MTELHPKAKELILLAKSGQEPSDEELQDVLKGFRNRARQRALTSVARSANTSSAPGAPNSTPSVPMPSGVHGKRSTAKPWSVPRGLATRHRALKWSLLAAIMTGSLGAFANWGTVVSGVEQVTERVQSLVAQVMGEPTLPRVTKTSRRGSSERAPTPVNEAAQTSREFEPALADQSPATDVTPIPHNVTSATVGGTPVGSGASGTATSGAATNGAAAVNGRSSTVSPPAVQSPPSLPSAAASSPPRGQRTPTGFSEQEVNLIAAARSALATGNYPQVRRLLDEHSASFAGGALSEERETLRALLACRETGNAELARRYVARNPQSLFASRLIRECGLVAPSSGP